MITQNEPMMGHLNDLFNARVVARGEEVLKMEFDLKMPRLEPKLYEKKKENVSLATALSKTWNFQQFVPDNKNEICNK